MSECGVFNVPWKKSLLTPTLMLLILSGCAERGEQSATLNHSSGARLVSLGNGVCRDVKSGKMWQVETSRTMKSLDEAKEYTANLKDGDYDDWRLPSVSELYDLYMTFDLQQNGDCELKIEGTFWSSEPDLEGRVGAWELDDNCDPERQYIPKQKGLVRAVRS